MASTYLSRTFSTPTSSKIMTFSAWIKRGKIGATGFGGYGLLNTAVNASGNGTYMQIGGDGNDRLQFSEYTPGETFNFKTNRAFRDTSAWYHIVIAYDSTQATASNRVKFYINGVQETSFQTANYPSLNLDTELNSAKLHYIGNDANAGGAYAAYYDGSMSHVHFIDGTAYDATAFGEYDANGVWKIKTSPSVTYGTNGFFILKDGNSVTDQSPNTNNWTVGGGTLTKTEDNPSNVFATLNPLANYFQQSTFSNGNNKMVTATSPYSYNVATMGISSGKYYWEIKYVSANENLAHIGVSGKGETISSTNPLGNNSTDYGYSPDAGGRLYKEGTFVSDSKYLYSIGDIIGIAIDMDSATKTLKLYQNGTLKSTDTISSTPESGFYFPALGHAYSAGQATFETNFGNGYFGTTAVASAGTNASGIGIFEYDVPTGYTALSTKGLNL